MSTTYDVFTGIIYFQKQKTDPSEDIGNTEKLKLANDVLTPSAQLDEKKIN
eukprot:gene9898-10914_t